MQEHDKAAKDDLRVEREVLIYLLSEGSDQVISEEMQERLGGREEVERATRSLIADGLVAEDGDKLVPTPASVRINELKKFMARQKGNQAA